MTVWPAKVQALHVQLENLGLWHLISPNRGQATSCREAAVVRRRLGAVGIPLWDELKSHVGAYESPAGRRYVAAHCRANVARDDSKIDALVGFPVVRVEAEELARVFGLEYGLVNPFALARHLDVLQFFDPSVLAASPAPSTMMTNAGHVEWGVEFHPAQVVERLDRSQVAELAVGTGVPPVADPALGILTGNGPESGIELWRRINAYVAASPEHAFRGDTSYPRVSVVSLPGMGMSMQLPVRQREVREVVLTGVDTLVSSGASVIGVACNTTQFFSPAIRDRCREHGVSFVSLVDATRKVLRDLGVSKVDLMGIGPVVDLAGWSDFKRLSDEIDIVVPSPRDVAQITELAWEVKARQEHTPGGAVGKLQLMLSRSSSTETILIALTELSVVLAEHPKIASRIQRETGKTVVDSLTALAHAMADRFLAQRAESAA